MRPGVNMLTMVNIPGGCGLCFVWGSNLAKKTNLWGRFPGMFMIFTHSRSYIGLFFWRLGRFYSDFKAVFYVCIEYMLIILWESGVFAMSKKSRAMNIVNIRFFYVHTWDGRCCDGLV